MSLFDISKLKIELSDLENQTIEENFWNDPKNSSNVLNKIKQLKTKCTDFSKIQKQYRYKYYNKWRDDIV